MQRVVTMFLLVIAGLCSQGSAQETVQQDAGGGVADSPTVPSPAADPANGGDAAGATGPAAVLERAVAAQPDSEQLHVQVEYRNRRLDPEDQLPARDRVWDLDIHVAVPDRYVVVQRERGDPEASTTYISDGVTTWTIEVEFADEAPLVSSRPVADDSQGTIGWINEFFPLDADRLQREFAFALAGDDAGGDAEAGAREGTHATTLIGIPITPRMAEHVQRLLLRVDAEGALQAVVIEDRHDNAMEMTVQSIEPDLAFDPERFTYDGPRPRPPAMPTPVGAVAKGSADERRQSDRLFLPPGRP
jgi:hypothetical protein